MKKMLVPWVVLPLVAACADSDMPTSSDALTTPSAAVVSSFSSNGKNAFAFAAGVLVFLSDNKFDVTHGSPGPTKSDGLTVLDFVTPCFDFVPLSKGDFSWSMSKADVSAATACGQVNISWSKTGPVTTGHQEDWFSFPTPDIENCSPPPGEFVFHTTSNGKFAPATASGTIGLAPFADPFASINHGVFNQKVCQ